MATLNYRELQKALKEAKNNGLTSVNLNSKLEVLQAEYDRLHPEVIDWYTANVPCNKYDLLNSYKETPKKYQDYPVYVVHNHTVHHTTQYGEKFYRAIIDISPSKILISEDLSEYSPLISKLKVENIKQAAFNLACFKINELINSKRADAT